MEVASETPASKEKLQAHSEENNLNSSILNVEKNGGKG